MDNGMTRGGGMAWKAAALLFAAFLMAFGPVGCSRKAPEESGNEGQKEKSKSAPLQPEGDSLAKPQGPAGAKVVPESSGKSGEEDDQEEPESEPEED